MSFSTTRWAIHDNNTLDSLKNIINNTTYKNDKIIDLKLKLDKKCSKKEFKIQFNNNIVSFLVYNASYKTDNAELIRENENTLILYTINDQEKVNIIIDKNTGAKSLLRKIFGFTGKGEIDSISNDVSSEFIIWLVNTVYNENGSYNDLSLDYVIGLKGDTDDSDSKVSIQGNNTMNILSSLSFLLESKNMKRIGIQIKFKNHLDIQLNLDKNNTVNVNRYIGPYEDDDFVNEYGNKCKDFLPILLIYCEILPLMLKWYDESNSDEDYGQNGNKLYKNFLKQLSEDLDNRISIRKKELGFND